MHKIYKVLFACVLISFFYIFYSNYSENNKKNTPYVAEWRKRMEKENIDNKNKYSNGDHDFRNRSINGDGKYGCLQIESTSRLIIISEDNDFDSFGKILSVAVLSGECILFLPGETVYIEDTKTFSGLVKIRNKGGINSYWTQFNSIK